MGKLKIMISKRSKIKFN